MPDGGNARGVVSMAVRTIGESIIRLSGITAWALFLKDNRESVGGEYN